MSGKFGKLGLGDEVAKNVPTLVRGALEGEQVVQVSTGKAHTGCVTSTGGLYIWDEGGGTQWNKLGQGVESGHILTPTRVEGALKGKDVGRVSCGDAHTACYTTDDTLYTFGTGTHGKLGHGDTAHKSVPTLVAGMPAWTHNSSPGLLCQVEASHYHTMCLTANGHLYCFGCNKFGKPGLGDEQARHVPERVCGVLDGQHVVQVSSGKTHSACVTAAGALFTWGEGEGAAWKKLGHGDGNEGNNVLVPVRVPFPEEIRVTQVRTGDAHTVALTMNASTSLANPTLGVYSWGLGADGKLGHGNTNAVQAPKLVLSWQHDVFCNI